MITWNSIVIKLLNYNKYYDKDSDRHYKEESDDMNLHAICLAVW